MATSTITKEWVEEQFIKALDTWKTTHPEPSDPNELNDRNEAFKIIEQVRQHALQVSELTLESASDSESTKKQKKICGDVIMDVAKPIYNEYMGKMIPFRDSQMMKGLSSMFSMFGFNDPNNAKPNDPKSNESKLDEPKSIEPKLRSRQRPVYNE